MSLIGGALEPAERLFIGLLDTDARGLKRAEIKRGIVIARLRGLRIVARHVAIGSGIGCGPDRSGQ